MYFTIWPTVALGVYTLNFKNISFTRNGNPLQCSCLENSRDGGAWWAAICGIAWSRTQLKQLSSSSIPLTGYVLDAWSKINWMYMCRHISLLALIAYGEQCWIHDLWRWRFSFRVRDQAWLFRAALWLKFYYSEQGHRKLLTWTSEGDGECLLTSLSKAAI